jgi:shikimate dehydrogenase
VAVKLAEEHGRADRPLKGISATTGRDVARPRASAVLAALIGRDIQDSRSPALHEEEGRSLGLSYIYRLIDLAALNLSDDALPLLIESAVRCGFDGVNITHPCKQSILPLLDAIDGEAAAIGAVNTVRISNGRTTGYNTDAWGFAQGLRGRLHEISLERVVQIGAGGAGAATAHSILQLGARRLALFDTNHARATALANSLRDRFGSDRIAVVEDLDGAIAAACGIIHATPVGMDAHPGLAVDVGLLRSDLWVADIVYMPLETELLRAARRAGCTTIDGSGMVVFQAAAAFEIFSGCPADAERMLRHFRSAAANKA